VVAGFPQSSPPRQTQWMPPMGPFPRVPPPILVAGRSRSISTRLGVRALVWTGQALRRSRPVSQRARTANQSSRLPRRLSGLLCLDLITEAVCLLRKDLRHLDASSWECDASLV
jgi:hypothetical protein